MPIYEYQCVQCAHIFEEWQHSHEDEGEKPCPQCGESAHRVVSHTSFILKGTGWYVTEYGNRASDTGAAENPAAASESSSGATTETTNETTNGTKTEPAASSETAAAPTGAAPPPKPQSAAPVAPQGATNAV